MNILVTANNTNGSKPGHEEWFDTITAAKKHADWMHQSSGLCNVEITEPLGVLLTHANGTKKFERAMDIRQALDVKESWKGVVANRKINRSRVTEVQIVGLPIKTAKATPEDAFVGDWMALALEDIRILPSMKYDINRWMDSKDWA